MAFLDLVLKRTAACCCCLALVAVAGNNGMAVKPPMQWRSWNQFSFNIDAAVILNAASALVDGSRPIFGLPAGSSLFDLGFNEAGIDEGWASCGPWPTGGWVFHRSNPDGSVSPVVNASLFPDMAGLIASVHGLGLRVGWYLNDCTSYCFAIGDTCPDDVCDAGDVAAWDAFGFDSVKLDGCSDQKNTSLWAALLNATGRAAVVENCHNSGNPVTPISEGGCPDYHLYRTSTDIRNTYGSWVGNAQTVAPFAADGRHGPTCWAYPDMLQVGVQGDINGAYYPPTLTEQRTHFGLWCILSAPLTLSLDFSNATAVDAVWDIISNAAAIGVDQAWAGSPGGVFASDSSQNVTLPHCTPNWDGDQNCTVPGYQAWYKPLPGGAAAVFVANHAPAANPSITVDFAAIPGLPCSASGCRYNVTDVWAQAPLGVVNGSYAVPSLASHDSLFLTLHPAAAS